MFSFSIVGEYCYSM